MRRQVRCKCKNVPSTKTVSSLIPSFCELHGMPILAVYTWSYLVIHSHLWIITGHFSHLLVVLFYCFDEFAVCVLGFFCLFLFCCVFCVFFFCFCMLFLFFLLLLLFLSLSIYYFSFLSCLCNVVIALHVGTPSKTRWYISRGLTSDIRCLKTERFMCLF